MRASSSATLVDVRRDVLHPHLQQPPRAVPPAPCSSSEMASFFMAERMISAML
jgi:hypothetical protein